MRGVRSPQSYVGEFGGYMFGWSDSREAESDGNDNRRHNRAILLPASQQLVISVALMSSLPSLRASTEFD
jgi:hypothetical protein